MHDAIEQATTDLKAAIADHGAGSPEHVEASTRLFNLCSLGTGDISSPGAVRY